ncbi:MAG: c-type cytochrome [Anaerolineae bacterium]|nr:c-type cytochrome [Anaerolineae bacterium]
MKGFLVCLLFVSVLLAACTAPFGLGQQPGVTWAPGSFDSNGERIYFAAVNDQDERIRYSGGPDLGGMMMGGYLTCASCHGPDARGGVHVMHMETMDAPDIRWSALAAHEEEEEIHQDEHEDYDLETFRLAVVEGRHPDGEPLSSDMPRWRMEDQDLADLAEYLQSLP